MTQSIIQINELRRIAKNHAMAVVNVEAEGGNGKSIHHDLLQEFQGNWQPSLSDKQYTALYKTYSDMVITSIANHYKPNSTVEKSPVQVSSIQDGNEIYRPNTLAMNPVQWEAYVHELVAMAEKFAHEIVVLAAHGGDTNERMKEQQLEAAKFALDHGLTEEEQDKNSNIYKESFLKVMEREANERTTRSNGAHIADSEECKAMVEEHWRAFLTFATLNSADLGKECIARFEEKIAKKSQGMGKDGKRWLKVMEEQRGLIFDEYTKNPAELKNRLGVSAPQQVNSQPQVQESKDTENLGIFVAKTAAKASILAAIFSIFRSM